MRTHTLFNGLGKQIPLLIVVLVGLLAPMVPAQSTINWTGFDGDVWTRSGSWDPIGLPSTSSIAVIDGGTGTILALREGTLAGGVSVGTLILANPSYTSIIAGASAASLNFGTNAGIVYARDTTTFSPFSIGNLSAVTGNLGQSLAIRFDELGTLRNFMRLTGTGSVTVSTSVEPTFFERAELDLFADSNGSLGTFSGGMVVNPGVVLGVAWDGTVNGSGTFTSGPMGIGTLTLKTENSGALASLRGLPEGPEGGERMIRNAVIVQPTSSEAVAALATCGTMNLAISGPVRALDSTGSTGPIEFAVVDTDSFPGVGTGTHSLTLSGPVTASEWTSTGAGTLILAADNSVTLGGVGTVGLSVVNAAANGALGDGAAEVYATSLAVDRTGVVGGQIGFVDGVNYTTYKELYVNGYGLDSGGVIRGGTGENRFAGRIVVVDDELFISTTGIGVDSGGTLVLSGTLELTTGTGLSVFKLGDGRLKFTDTNFVTTGTGQILNSSSGPIELAISSGTTRSFAGHVGLSMEKVNSGHLIKTGAGTFEAYGFGATTLDIQGGVLKLAQEGTNVFGGSGDINQIRVNALTLAGGSSPSVKLDLANNEMVIDYTGTSPLNGGTSSTLFQQIDSAYNNGSWNGNGITSFHANSGTFAIGYGEASTNFSISGTQTATFASQEVDATSVLLKLTYYGDANLDGTTTLADYVRLAPNFNGTGLWTEGDSDYDGDVDLADYGLMAATWNGTVVARGRAPGRGKTAPSSNSL